MKITESGQLTKAGLGLVPQKPIPAEGSKEYRDLVVSMVKKEEDERLYTAAIQQGIQGQWTRWKGFIQRDLRWKNVMAGPPALTGFCLGATYGTLATPANLKRWGLSGDSKCELDVRKKMLVYNTSFLAATSPSVREGTGSDTMKC